MNSLIGIWLLTGMIYQGNVISPPNPHLKLFYIFQNSAVNEVYYYRDNEAGYCRRTAEYSVDTNNIYQKIVAVDPGNNSDCSLDTDMQMGNQSKVKYEIIDNKFHLHLPLGEESLVYIFTKNDQ